MPTQYCGPWKLTIRTGSEVNEICKDHDEGYGIIQNEYKSSLIRNPAYRKWNFADMDMYNRMKVLHDSGRLTDKNEHLAWLFISKKYALYQRGIIGYIQVKPEKMGWRWDSWKKTWEDFGIGTRDPSKIGRDYWRRKYGSDPVDYYNNKIGDGRKRRRPPAFRDPQRKKPKPLPPPDFSNDMDQFNADYKEDYYLTDGSERKSKRKSGNMQYLTAQHKAHKVGSVYKKRKNNSVYMHPALYRAIQKIAKGVAFRNAIMEHRYFRNTNNFSQITHSVNECTYTVKYCMDRAAVDSAWSTVDMYGLDHSGPSMALANNVNLTVVTGAELPVVFWKQSYKIKNNYAIPCMVELFKIVPKVSSNLDAIDAIDSGLDDLGLPATGITNGPDSGREWIQYGPKRSKVFNRYWKIVWSAKYMLNAGDEVDFVLSNGNVMYCPEAYDQDTTKFVDSMTTGLLIKQYGVLSHDSITHSQVGYSDGAIDFAERIEYCLGTGMVGKTVRLEDVSNYQVMAGGGAVALDGVIADVQQAP